LKINNVERLRQEGGKPRGKKRGELSEKKKGERKAYYHKKRSQHPGRKRAFMLVSCSVRNVKEDQWGGRGPLPGVIESLLLKKALAA